MAQASIERAVGPEDIFWVAEFPGRCPWAGIERAVGPQELFSGYEFPGRCPSFQRPAGTPCLRKFGARLKIGIRSRPWSTTTRTLNEIKRPVASNYFAGIATGPVASRWDANIDRIYLFYRHIVPTGTNAHFFRQKTRNRRSQKPTKSEGVVSIRNVCNNEGVAPWAGIVGAVGPEAGQVLLGIFWIA
jgi:hypothetical protein